MASHLKSALRSITHTKSYSSINILGLTIGLATCMIVATVVIDDLSYDRAWKNSAQLYRIVTVSKMGGGLYNRNTSVLTGVSTQLKADYPQVKATASMYNRSERFKLDDTDPNGVEVSVLSADTSIWQMLDLEPVAGNSRSFVAGTGNIVLTESFARQHFGGKNPVGLKIYSVPTYSDKPQPYLITGIVKDLPANSIFRAELISLKKPSTDPLYKEQYGSFTPDNFVLVRPGTDIKSLASKFNRWYTHFATIKNPFQFDFQPLRDVYLRSEFAANQTVKGDIGNIYIFSGIALLILFTACVNYINLSTARAVKRLPETGIRKVLGAGRGALIRQFLTESFVYFLISALLATLLYGIFLPLVERYLGHPLALTFISQYGLFALAYGIIFIIGLLAGFYPAWILSGFKPAATLKGKLSLSPFGSAGFVRKSLVVLQFTISIIVLVALIVVRQQVSYLKNKDLGFDKSNLLSIGDISWNGKGDAFKADLLSRPGIVSASITPWSPSTGAFMTKEIDDPLHPDKKLEVWFLSGDVDLAKTIGLHLTSGRLLDRSFAADEVDMDSMMRMNADAYNAAASRESSLITSYTAKVLGANLNTTMQGALTSPVGIVQDFNNESLKKPLSPTIIIAEKSPMYGGLLVRVAPGYEKPALAFITKKWREFFPDKLLEPKWVTDILAGQYKTETALQQLFTCFSSLSMFLAALGIFGLIIHSTQQRRREIGVRKVLGATVGSIVQLFSFDFLKLISLGLVIASPLAWWLMSAWLTDYAYRISMSPWMLAAAGLLTLTIALVTISLQVVKAAIENPVKSLRTE